MYIIYIPERGHNIVGDKGQWCNTRIRSAVYIAIIYVIHEEAKINFKKV